MENLLFSDVPQNDTKVMKSMKVTRIVLIILCAIVLLFAVLGLILKDIVIVIDSVIGIVLFFSLFITCLCMEQQYLLVFTDKIKYKKGLSGKKAVDNCSKSIQNQIEKANHPRRLYGLDVVLQPKRQKGVVI